MKKTVEYVLNQHYWCFNYKYIKKIHR
jgi:hypothetical protein